MKKLLEFLLGLVKVLFGVDSESPAPEKPRETPVEETVTGWAVIPDGMTLPGVLAYADITTEARDGLPTVTAITPRPDLVAQAEAAAAAAQEEAKKQAEQMAQLPTTEERIAALEAAMLDLLAGEEE